MGSLIFNPMGYDGGTIRIKDKGKYSEMKRWKRLAISGFVSVFALGFGGWFVVTSPMMVFSHRVVQSLADQESLEGFVKKLSADIGPKSHTDIQNLNEAADFIFKVFSRYGEPTFQTYEAGGRGYKNVLLRIPGTDGRCKALYVVGAHYDTDHGLPGADDNASGVAGVLELARLLYEDPPRCSVELVAYTLEEMPHFRQKTMGSYVHAQKLYDNSEDVALMISVEMIGYFQKAKDTQFFPLKGMKYFYSDRGDFIAIVGSLESFWDVRKLKRSFLKPTR